MKLLSRTLCFIAVAHSAPALVAAQGARPAAGGDLAIVGATVIDPGGGAPRPGQTILVRGGRIAAVGATHRVRVPAGMRRLDATGRWVMPGLADMHLHVTFSGDSGRREAPVLRDLMRWGVTTLLNPGAFGTDAGDLRRLVDRDDQALPRLLMARGMFTSPGGYGAVVPGVFTPTTPDEARRQVRDLRDEGYRFVKLAYSDNSYLGTKPFPTIMDPAIMRTVIDEAHAQRMRVIVHAPELRFAKEALRAGGDALAHGVVDAPVDADFLTLLRQSGAAYIGTTVLFRAFGGLQPWVDLVERFDTLQWVPADEFAKRRAMGVTGLDPRADKAPFPAEQVALLAYNLRAVHAAGAPLLIGTDVPLPGSIPGIATHLEMALLEEAGVPARDVLYAATAGAATFARHDAVFGRVAKGYVADLLVLDGDPTVTVRNTRLIRHVIRSGRVAEGRGSR